MARIDSIWLKSATKILVDLYMEDVFSWTPVVGQVFAFFDEVYASRDNFMQVFLFLLPFSQFSASRTFFLMAFPKTTMCEVFNNKTFNFPATDLWLVSYRCTVRSFFTLSSTTRTAILNIAILRASSWFLFFPWQRFLLADKQIRWFRLGIVYCVIQ